MAELSFRINTALDYINEEIDAQMDDSDIEGVSVMESR